MDSIHGANNLPLTVGSRVRIITSGPHVAEEVAHRGGWANFNAYASGTVTEITEWDGDYDSDLECSVSYPPTVRVIFEDGCEDTFSTSWEFFGGEWDDGAEGTCDDLDVIE